MEKKSLKMSLKKINNLFLLKKNAMNNYNEK